MINFSRLTYILFVFGLIACSSVFAKVPKKFLGSWTITLEKKAGFPWWQQIKYPVKLHITETGVKFFDQSGFECNLDKILYDDEIDILVIKHCLPSKHQNTYDVFYRISFESGSLIGESWTYRPLFKWVGEQGTK